MSLPKSEHRTVCTDWPFWSIFRNGDITNYYIRDPWNPRESPWNGWVLETQKRIMTYWNGDAVMPNTVMSGVAWYVKIRSLNCMTGLTPTNINSMSRRKKINRNSKVQFIHMFSPSAYFFWNVFITVVIINKYWLGNCYSPSDNKPLLPLQ